MTIVNFFIAGVQKGGTTALDRLLRAHPGIQMARVKEVHHFDDEKDEDWSAPSHQRLNSQYDWSIDGVLRGEATPVYTYWPSSMERIRNYNPNAKLIILFRHPAYRAYSHWKMETFRGKETLSFEMATSNTGRNRVLSAPGGAHRVFSYIERGLYSSQTTRALSLLPRSQILFLRTDRLWREPERTLGDIYEFLGVEILVPKNMARSYVVPTDSSALGTMSRKTYLHLLEFYRNDITKTATLSGLDLSDWLSSEYLEPMEVN